MHWILTVAFAAHCILFLVCLVLEEGGHVAQLLAGLFPCVPLHITSTLPVCLNGQNTTFTIV